MIAALGALERLEASNTLALESIYVDECRRDL